jgi:hypothetical protein
MPKPLSQQLSDLAVHAKKAEDAIAAAQKESHDKVMARREQTRAAAAATVDKVNQEFKAVGEAAAQNWNALKTKIAADIDSLKATVAERRQERDMKRAEDHAQKLERQATVAIDYAIASIEQAKLAVLDAVIGRMEAQEGRRA